MQRYKVFSDWAIFLFFRRTPADPTAMLRGSAAHRSGARP